jgi:hypothetical protein
VTAIASSGCQPTRAVFPAAPVSGARKDVGRFSVSLATSSRTGAELAICGSGTTCSATVTQSSPGTQDFEAFVGDDVAGDGQPGFVVVSSNEVPSPGGSPSSSTRGEPCAGEAAADFRLRQIRSERY